MKKWIRLIVNTETILYLVFGVLSTVVNLLIFSFLHDYRNVGKFTATVAAWIVAVIFAFITNKILVFRSKSIEKRLFLREAAGFFGARLVTLGVEVAGLWFLWDVLGIHGEIIRRTVSGVTLILTWETVCKAFVNVVVILLNYVFSKLFIFRNPRGKGEENAGNSGV